MFELFTFAGKEGT